MIVAKYKFNSTLYPDGLVPDFNEGYTAYTVTDDANTETDSNGNIIITRTITSETLPTTMRFGQLYFTGETGPTNKSKCLLEVLDMDTSNLINMNKMFRFCNSLTSITCTWNTSSVIDMSGMFEFCSSLTSLDVSGFDTSKVTSMDSMFAKCSSLISLDLNNWNTSSVKNMNNMFKDCLALTSLDISGFDTSNVTDMEFMFRYCRSLASLDVSNWNTNNVTDMDGMFYNCQSLKYLDLRNITNNAAKAEMLYNTKLLSTLDITNINIPNYGGFFGSSCPVKYIKCHNKDVINTIADQLNYTRTSDNPGYILTDTLDGITSDTISALSAKNWNVVTTSNVIAKYKFNSNTYKNLLPVFNADYYVFVEDEVDNNGIVTRTIKHVDTLPTKIKFGFRIDDTTNTEVAANSLLEVIELKTDNITDLKDMFRHCKKLVSVNSTNWNTSKVDDMSCIFEHCKSLVSLDVSKWNTSKVADMRYMFCDCPALTLLDVSNFDTSKVTSMGSMFDACSSLTSLDVSNFDTSKVTSMTAMFYKCSSLISLDVSNFDTSKVTNMTNMFNSLLLTSLDVSNFDTSKVTNMTNMFRNCSSLISLDVSNFNTSKVTNMDNMFNNCNKLTSLDLSNFVTNTVTDMNCMFLNNKSLKYLDISNLDLSLVPETTAGATGSLMASCTNLTDIGMLYCNSTTVNKVIQRCTEDRITCKIWVQKTKASSYTATDYVTIRDYKETVNTLYLDKPLEKGDKIYANLGGNTDKPKLEDNYETVKLDSSWSQWQCEGPSKGGRYYISLPHGNTYINHKPDRECISNIKSGEHLSLTNNVVDSIENIPTVTTFLNGSNQIRLYVPGLTTLGQYKEWLDNNDVYVTYERDSSYSINDLSTEPYISTSYANGNILVSSSVPPVKINTLGTAREEVYLEPSKTYTIQFVSSANTTISNIKLGSNTILARDVSVVRGLNRIQVTTDETITSTQLQIHALNATISDIVVTSSSLPNGYFEGIKSTFEGELVTQEMVNQGKEEFKNVGKYKVNMKVAGKNKANSPNVTTDWGGASINTNGSIVTFTPNSSGSMGIETLEGLTSRLQKIHIPAGTKITLSTSQISGGAWTEGSMGVGVLLYSEKPKNAFDRVEHLVIDNTPKNYGTVKSITTTLTNNIEYMSVHAIGWSVSGATGEYKYNVQLEIGDTATDYEPYKEYNLSVYLRSPLYKGDRLEWKDGNLCHYHTKDVYSITANSDFSFYPRKEEYTGCSGKWRWSLKGSSKIANVKGYKNGWLYCNSYPSQTADDTWLCKKDGVSQNSSNNVLQLYLERYADGSDESRAKLIEELKAKQPTIVYTLANPYYEIVADYRLVQTASNNATVELETDVSPASFNLNALELDLGNKLKPNTTYTLQYRDRSAKKAPININLGGATESTTSNKELHTFTTPDSLANTKLVIDGEGAVLNDLVLSEGTANSDEYFEGLLNTFEDTYDETTGKYIAEIKSCGKNLLDPSIYANLNETSAGLTIINEGNGIFSVNGTTDGSKGDWFLVDWKRPNIPSDSRITKEIMLQPGTYTLSANILEGNIETTIPDSGYYFAFRITDRESSDSLMYMGAKTSKTFTINHESRFGSLRIYTPTNYTTTFNNVRVSFQLERGSSATTYEPYTETTKKVYLTSPLLKGDKLVWVDNSKLVHRHNMGIIKLNGASDENWTAPNNADTENFVVTQQYALKNSNANKLSTSTGVICNRFSYAPKSVDREGFDTATGSYFMYININKDKLSTISIAGFKSWLQEHPLTVVYQLAEPYDEIVSTEPLTSTIRAKGMAKTVSLVPPSVITFKPFIEHMNLVANTNYLVQFLLNRDREAEVTLGGTKITDVQAKYDRKTTLIIKTPSPLVDDMLIINGKGAKVGRVVVSEIDSTITDVELLPQIDYFEGIKSTFEEKVDNDGKYLVDVVMRNKNVLPWPYYDFKDSNTVTRNGITAKLNNDGSITFSGTNTSSSNVNFPITLWNDKYRIPKGKYRYSTGSNNDKIDIQFGCGAYLLDYNCSMYSGCNPTFVVDSNMSIGHICIICKSGGVYDNVTVYPQLEMGDTATSFVKPASEKLSLKLNSPLLKGDKIVYRDGKFWHYHKMGTMVLNGGSNIANAGTENNGVYRWLVAEDLGIGDLESAGIIGCYSDRYPSVTASQTWRGIAEGIAQNNSGHRIVLYLERYKDGSDESKAKLIAELTANPTTVVYELANPYYEEISTDRQTLKVAKSLTIQSAVPAVNTKFKPYIEEGLNLLPNTKYLVQFNATNVKSEATANISLGGSAIEGVSVSAGNNRYAITTPNELSSNQLVVEGIKGFELGKVIVSEQYTEDSVEYFEGISSFGESKLITDASNANYGKYAVNIKMLGINAINIINNISNIERGTKNENVITTSPTSGSWSWIRIHLVKPIKIYEGRWYFKFAARSSSYTRGVNKFRLERFKDDLFMETAVKTLNPDHTTEYQNYEFLVDIKQNVEINSVFIQWGSETAGHSIDIKDMMLSQESNANYEPYHEVSKTIYLNSPMYDGDKLVMKDGRLCHYHTRWSLTLDGSDDEGWIVGYPDIIPLLSSANVSDFNSSAPNINSNIINNAKAFCNKFNIDTIYSSNNNTGICLINLPDYNSFNIRIRLPENNTVENLTSMLSAEPAIIVYQIAEPYYEDIQDINPDITSLKFNDTDAKPLIVLDDIIPADKVVFKAYEETLPLSANTKHIVQFNTKDANKAINVSLGNVSAEGFNSVIGRNRVDIITGNITDENSKLIIDGQGTKANNVIVSDQYIDADVDYFEGLRNAFDKVNAEGKYPINIRFLGKNLWDEHVVNEAITNHPETGVTKTVFDGREVYHMPKKWNSNIVIDMSWLPIGNYRLTFNTYCTNRSSDGTGAFIKIIYDDNNNSDNYLGDSLNNERWLTGTIDINSSRKVKEIVLASSNNCETYIDVNIQLERGNVSTEFEQYNCITKTITLNSPLLKGDTIEYVNGKLSHKHVSRHIITEDSNIEYENTIIHELGDGRKEVVYELAQPVIEEIAGDMLSDIPEDALMVYESLVPVAKTKFTSIVEDVAITPSTEYTIFFHSDRIGEEVIIRLGGKETTHTITNNDNKVDITTKDTLDNKRLVIEGNGGVIINKVVLTEKVDNARYFEGMKSTFEDGYKNGVYETDIVIMKDTEEISREHIVLTVPLLQGDKLVIKDDGKVYHEHHSAKYVFKGTENWSSEISTEDRVARFWKDSVALFAEDRQPVNGSLVHCNVIPSAVYDKLEDLSIDMGIGMKNTLKTVDLGINLPLSMNITTSDDLNTWLLANKAEIVYELAQPYDTIVEDTDLQLPISEGSTIQLLTNVAPTLTKFRAFKERVGIEPATKYLVRFNAKFTNSSIVNANVNIGLGGTVLPLEVSYGVNKIGITTPGTLIDEYLTIDGQAIEIDHVICTKYVDNVEYFEGRLSAFEDALVVEDENPAHIGKYQVKLTTIGRNLYPGVVSVGKAINMTAIGDEFALVDNEECSCTSELTYLGGHIKQVAISDENGQLTNCIVAMYNQWKQLVGYVSCQGYTAIPDGIHYIAVEADKDVIGTSLQIEANSTVSAYEAYWTQEESLYLDQPLYVGDKIVSNSGRLRIYHASYDNGTDIVPLEKPYYEELDLPGYVIPIEGTAQVFAATLPVIKTNYAYTSNVQSIYVMSEEIAEQQVASMQQDAVALETAFNLEIMAIQLGISTDDLTI